MNAPRRVAIGLFPLLLAPLGGCPAPAPAGPVIVQLVNPTSRDVRPNLHVGPADLTRDALFTDANLVRDFTDRAFPELRPGETRELSLTCEQAGAIGVARPVLFDPATLTTQTAEQEILLRRDQQFACGATLRFVFFTESDGSFRVRLEE